MLSTMAKNTQKPLSGSLKWPTQNVDGSGNVVPNNAIDVPSHIAGSGSLDRLVESARAYASYATAENTNKAYKTDWAHYTRWCRMRGTDRHRQVIGVSGIESGRDRSQAAFNSRVMSSQIQWASALVWR